MGATRTIILVFMDHSGIEVFPHLFFDIPRTIIGLYAYASRVWGVLFFTIVVNGDGGVYGLIFIGVQGMGMRVFGVVHLAGPPRNLGNFPVFFKV